MTGIRNTTLNPLSPPEVNYRSAYVPLFMKSMLEGIYPLYGKDAVKG